jgi:histidinol phosphatase-like enzyme
LYYCPHHPDAPHPRYAVRCKCRKPAAGMLLQAAGQHALDLERSWMVGDTLDDVEAGHRAGCRAILIDNGNETEWRAGPDRHADVVVTNLAQAARIIVSAAADASLAATGA